MYMSPLILLVLEPAFGLGDDDLATGLLAYDILSLSFSHVRLRTRLTARIGGTSTCCMPFLACI